MAKKKDKPQVINNIQELNLEIDYDKLAEAIVKANAQRSPRKKSNMKVRGFIFGMCNGILYLAMAYYIIEYTVKMWYDFAVQHTPSIMTCIVTTVISCALTILLYIAQQETCNDTDEEVLSHFNTSIGFVALIVALIALLKGVG